MHYYLKFTNPWGEIHYFCNLGGFWGPNDTRRLIERTSTQLAQARAFDTVDEAREVLTLSDNAKNPKWQVVDEAGEAVK